MDLDGASLRIFLSTQKEYDWTDGKPGLEIIPPHREKIYRREIIQSEGLVSLLIPLESEQGVIGVLGFHYTDSGHQWSELDIELGESLAAQISLMIVQSQSYQQIQSLAQREALINSITGAIRSSLEPVVIFQAITHQLGQALDVDGCALSLWTPEEEFVHCVGLYDREGSPDSLPQSIVPIAQNPVLQEMIRTSLPVSHDDLTTQPLLNQFDLPLHSLAKALLIVPLIVNGAIIGSISLRQIHRVRHWTKDEIDLAQAVANQAGIAVQQARQAQKLQESEQRVQQLNQYLTESVLKRFLPASIVNQVAAGELVLDLRPETRFITILFSDIVDFTHLAHHLSPYHLTTLLNEYLAAMTETVFTFGGTVDKFVGDGIMALFGAPEMLSPSEQVERAIAVAAKMQVRLEQLNQDWLQRGLIDGEKIPLIAFRCGIHQGAAVVGMFGGHQRSDYTAIGSTVNIAARLQEAAPPNTILVSETVATYLGDQYCLQGHGFKLKGIDEELRAFSLRI